MGKKHFTGNYDVATCDSDDFLGKREFAAFPEDNIKVGDIVMVDDDINGRVICIVRQLNNYSDIPVSGEIICKLDYANFEKRKETRKKLDTIKEQMDNILNKQDMILYEEIAKENPEMEVLLNQYKEIAGLNDDI